MQELTVRKTPSLGWTRMVMRLGAMSCWSEKIIALGLDLNWTMISVLDSCNAVGWLVGPSSQWHARDVLVPFPAVSRKGTPVHLSLSMRTIVAQNVAHFESFDTSSSSLNAGFSPSEDLAYWPMIVSTFSIAGIVSRTRT